MRIALCLSGQLRMVEACYPSIYAGLMEGYDVDTFIHAWYDSEKAGQAYEHGAWHDTVPGMTGGVVRPGMDARVRELYSPVKDCIVPPADFTQEANECLKIIHSHVALPDWGNQTRFAFCPLSMFYSIWMANELKRQHEQEHGLYDAVVRCRFDMQVHQRVRYEALDLSAINTSWTYWADYGGVGDCLAIGNSPNMDVYSGVYPEFKRLCAVTENPAPDHPQFFAWGTEALLAQHLQDYGVTVNPSVIQAGNLRE